ncbi:ABC transporter substrate-binding protein [Spirosoma sp. KUDC1026]|uniref:ABC transporter substrate-binding protein n=1 Tax=Spirosoma sp. KUDC1026 TaxID=2745947 RepID=UPI00159BED91|nr:ABC transporter substrate-binding protein [Spirosoma sp. KUDC1026]QKZ15384.1 ABC transporter substrate-binding protein [Spirosoma sp. KUDC1026]
MFSKNLSSSGQRTHLARLFLYCLVLVSLTRFSTLAQPSAVRNQSIAPSKRSASNRVTPDRITVRYARGFTIQYFGNYKLVSIISPFEKKTDTVRYVLVQRGTPAPKGYAPSQIIRIPLRRMVLMSSMHVGLAGFLEAEEQIVGLGNLKYVSSPKVIQRIDAGKVQEVGHDQTLNEEQLVSLQPDLLMATGSPTAQMNRYQTLRNAGVPVLINSEWVETTPLGRAEWVKLMAALLNKEALVNQKFAQVEREYNRLAALARNVASKPSIISGMNAKDAWFVPDGDSYITRFFLDAGGSYPWSNRRTTGSLPLNFEAVYPIALNADYWLNIGLNGVSSKKDVLAKDSRYADFAPFKSGQMYSYGKRMNNRGANDYWESGAVNPHVVLADLIKIMHPKLLPKHQLVYYKQLN